MSFYGTLWLAESIQQVNNLIHNITISYSLGFSRFMRVHQNTHDANSFNKLMLVNVATSVRHVLCFLTHTHMTLAHISSLLLVVESSQRIEYMHQMWLGKKAIWQLEFDAKFHESIQVHLPLILGIIFEIDIENVLHHGEDLELLNQYLKSLQFIHLRAVQPESTTLAPTFQF
jgi:hypothetical protein